jgi:hypothetical protein
VKVRIALDRMGFCTACGPNMSAAATAGPAVRVFRLTGSGGCACDSRTPVSKIVGNYQWCRWDCRVQKGELCDGESVLTLALRPGSGALARERQWHYFR